MRPFVPSLSLLESDKYNIFSMKENDKNKYPLYDVPWLVREPNDSYMSLMRYKIEVRNQAVVDDYFIERDKGTSAEWA